MSKIVTVEQMQAIEKSANASGLSYEQMMHNAGEGVADWISENLPIKKGVVGLVGSGNNGGDTLIALTSLTRRGVRTIAFLARDREKDPLIEDYSAIGGQIVDISHKNHMDLFQAAIQPGTIILDGILGTGLRLPLRGELKEVMSLVKDAVNNRPGGLVVAVDCPSGMDCDTGEVSQVTLNAVHTLCMAAIKQGLLKHPGRDYVGELHLIRIGIKDISNHIVYNLPVMIEEELVRQYLPIRSASGHKGTFGTCQVVAGTAAFTGAAYLAGKSAYLSGCGLVSIATLNDVQQRLAGQLIEAVWMGLPELEFGYDPDSVGMLAEKLNKADSIIIGPGFGLAVSTRDFVHKLLKEVHVECPVLIDADGLKLLSQMGRWWEHLPEDVILTPHPGEMAVMSGLSVDEIQADRWGIARNYAKKWGAILVLKGAETVLATPDGSLFVNPVSDPSLATAGSGDVLSGIIGGLLAQGSSSKKASVAGVWIHSQAGLTAKRSLGTDISVTATDILESIHAIFHHLAGKETIQ